MRNETVYEVMLVNNLSRTGEREDANGLARQIYELAISNIIQSNFQTYNQEDMELLLKSKTLESYKTLVSKSFVVCVYNDCKELIGCGLVSRQDGRYFAKSLHVHKNYRSLGIAKMICEEREKFLINHGVTQVFIESLKFPKTKAFHKKRGFTEIPPYKELKNTVLMRKTLI